MNALGDNEFTRAWRAVVQPLPKPRAILCISAHWETQGTFVTSMEKPRTIHDFGGFPRELFDFQYPAPGNPQLAKEIEDGVTKTLVTADTRWGLDHGAWSVICHMYPNATVPVVQLSLDYSQPPQYHYDLAKELASLRNKGVLIVGSGNMVHNLRAVDWQNPDSGFDWALEADALFRKLILTGDHAQLIHYAKLGSSVSKAIPTPEHFLPLLYVLALRGEKDSVSFFNQKVMMGSLSMTSVRVG
jgi:4,5-DOPA dioxygenase extradiol